MITLKAYPLGIAILLLPAVVQGKEPRHLEPSQVPAVVTQAPGHGPGTHLCWLSAYSTDTDPKGTNIRAAPSRDAPVLGTIPGGRAEAGTGIGPEFQVIASRDGWLLVHNVRWAGYDLDEKLLFPGPGWIAAGLVSFSAEDPLLRSAPRVNAPEIGKLLPVPDVAPAWGPSEVIIKRIHRCSGSFVDVDLETPDGHKARGWVSGACANQVTTCGGGGRSIEEHGGRLVEVERL